MNKQIELGKYGEWKLRYMKEFQQSRYKELKMKNELTEYLISIDKQAEQLYETMLANLKQQRNITEELKKKDQMKWVQEMNTIHHIIEEFIKHDIIYD